MYESDVLDVPQRALTGALPSEPRVTALLHEAHARYATLDSGAVLVMVLGVGIGRAVVEHPELPEELVAQVDLDEVNFVSNDELYEALSRTTATEEQVRAAVELNEEQRLRTLKTGFLLLAGLSAVAALPASRLPKYVPSEIPDPEPVPTD